MTSSRKVTITSRMMSRVGQVVIVMAIVLSVVVVQANTTTMSDRPTADVERMFTSDKVAFEEAVRKCDYDRFFVSRLEECRSVRRTQMDLIKKCSEERYQREHEQLCQMIEFYTQTQQARCVNDEIFSTLEVESCRDMREHTMKLEEQCASGEFGHMYRRMCESNRMYAIQAFDQVCGETRFFEEHRRQCEGLRMTQQRLSEQCRMEEFFRRHELACEYFFYYMWATRHRCAADLTFHTQYHQVCKNQEYYTQQQQENCNQDTEYYQRNKRTCIDNEHYYVKQQQEKCVKDTQYYQENTETCKRHIYQAHALQATCDQPTYYKQHQTVCDVQRYYVQAQQQKCNDKTFYTQHQEACEVQRTATKHQQEKCTEEQYYVEHRKTCKDNQHYYVQMKQLQCHVPTYYQQHAQECQNVQRVHNVNLLEKCDTTTYQMVHTQACESQRYVTQKQQTVCDEATYAQEHQQVCEDVKTAKKEQQERCTNQEYYTQHKQTCQDVQNVTATNYMRIFEPRMTFDRCATLI